MRVSVEDARTDKLKTEDRTTNDDYEKKSATLGSETVGGDAPLTTNDAEQEDQNPDQLQLLKDKFVTSQDQRIHRHSSEDDDQ